ncbi:MAG: hypothetical protein ACJ8HJ_25880, partial [Massilia sp.]
AVWKNFPHSTLSWQDQAFLVGLAMLVGLAVGWMLVNRAIRQLTYQRDLLALAMRTSRTPGETGVHRMNS